MFGIKNFLNKLIDHLKKCTVSDYISYSFDKWVEFITESGNLNSHVAEYIMDKTNKEKINEFVESLGILNLNYTEDRILKRYIIGFDYDLSIRIRKDIDFEEYFVCYGEYLKNHPINNSFKLKLILSVMSKYIHVVPKLATFDTIENDWQRVGYNIYYSGDVSESLTINIRDDLKNNLVVLSDKRGDELSDIIEQEMNDFCDLLSHGLFNLIIHDNYPVTLEDILPEEEYRSQVEDRILKDETAVRYENELYKSIRLGSSYVIVDSNMHAIDDREKAEAIYCKINLSKYM